ncbi:RNA-directed DNA polymerase [Sporosarcina sp. SAFN-010]|uniref:RNA-directed DNA polymerase n=1 Tax=Sporosarcina sp. SAFN-010 TaxID=3387273 RepID=UPI003F7F3A8A
MKVSKYKVRRINNRIIYSSPRHQKIFDSTVNKEIKMKYAVETSNRNYIIDALLTVMTNKNNMIAKNSSLTILRLDIKNFFGSVNTHLLYQRLSRSMMLKNSSMNKIKEIVFSNKIKGLPQGVSFSSALSEIYLEDFDRLVPITLPNVILYERFVDDIILVLHGNHKQIKNDLISSIQNLLSSYKLELNDKTQLEVINKENSFKFTYLGYCFESNRGSTEIIISVSKEKLEKYLGNINLLFSNYYHSHKTDKDFFKLYYSLRNLLWTTETMNYSKNTTISFGFKNSYKRINNLNSYEVINKVILKHLYSSRLFLGMRKKYLHSLRLRSVRQHYNFNKATLSQLEYIADRLCINRNEIKSNEKLVKYIFKELYR